MKNNEKLTDRVGQVFETRQGYNATIIEYKNSRSCKVLFSDGNTVDNVIYTRLTQGGLKNPYHRTLYNIGYLGEDRRLRGQDYLIYKSWANMLKRCYNEKCLQSEPTYRDVTVCEEWHNYQVFAEWHKNNYNFDTMKGWQLDKDILVKGNKIYSPQTCAFVPREVNITFTDNKSKTKIYPRGVTKRNNRFTARTRDINGKNVMYRFDTPEEAFQSYKKVREERIKFMADKWKDLIDPRVYEALYNYKVEITD